MEPSFVVLAVSIWTGQIVHIYGPFDRLAADTFEHNHNGDLGDHHRYESFQIQSADAVAMCQYGAHR